MAPSVLQSDHVTYLVWRYLQERGYGNAAAWLQRDWDQQDPESTLSFTKYVKTGTLINLCQDGLVYDSLTAAIQQDEARARNVTDGAQQPREKRYRFLDVPLEPRMPRKRPASRSPDRYEPSRPSSSSLHHDQGRKRSRVEATNGVRKPADPTSARRKSVKSASAPHIGAEEGMDLDARDEAIQDETDHVEEPPPPPPLSTLEIGISSGVNTDTYVDKTLAKSLCNFSIPDSDIVHTSWDARDTSRLHVAGGSVWRSYTVPTVPDQINGDEPAYSPHTTFSGPFYVSAVTNHADTGRISYALNEQIGMGNSSVHVMMGNDRDRTLLSSPRSNTLFLRWNVDASRLLGSSHTPTADDSNQAGLASVWSPDSDDSPETIRLNEPAFDGVWIDDHKFALCGSKFLDIFDVKGDGAILRVKHIQTELNWDLLRFDRRTSQLACLSCDDGYLGVMSLLSYDLRTVKASEDSLTALDFQPPHPTAPPAQPRYIATASLDFSVKLWDAAKLECVKKCCMFPASPVMTLAFSPDGSLLAMAGERRVEVWKASINGERVARWTNSAPVQVNGTGSHDIMQIDHNGKNDRAGVDDDDGPFHALAWDAKGEKLAYTQGSQVSVIEMPAQT